MTKILAIADVPADAYYEYYRPGCLDEFDLILSAGDLDAEYLEFLVTLAHCPLVYVRGNHDDDLIRNPPGGCDCAEDTILTVAGLRILGLGGSNRYKDFCEGMYDEGEMRWRIRKLWRKLRKHKGFDILLTHAPARGVNDFDTDTHRGFECFNGLLEKYQPSYFVHGHVHMSYDHTVPQVSHVGATTVINAYDHCVFEYEGGAGAR